MNVQNPKMVPNDGFEIAAYSAGPTDGPPILLVHGWPEIAHSWTPIIPALVAAGHHVVSYDLRGFGRSSTPLGDEHYAMPQLVSDMEAVMDAYGLAQPIICGHDWGGSIVWHAARMISHRVSGVIGICVPHTARAPAPPLKIIEKRFGEKHYFIEFLKRPDEVAQTFARDPDSFFRLMFRSTPEGAKMDEKFTFIPSKFADFLAAGAPELRGVLLDEAERAPFVEAYDARRFRTAVNLYRNIDVNWELAEGMSNRITQPVLMISPEGDLLLPPALAEPMDKMCPNLTRTTIPRCGHWAMWDAPDALVAKMLQWLSAQAK